MSDLDKILQQFDAVKGQRSSWEASREDIKKFVCPESPVVE